MTVCFVGKTWLLSLKIFILFFSSVNCQAECNQLLFRNTDLTFEWCSPIPPPNDYVETSMTEQIDEANRELRDVGPTESEEG